MAVVGKQYNSYMQSNINKYSARLSKCVGLTAYVREGS
jgi:hypothetical protein